MVEKTTILSTLVAKYFTSRPNLDLKRPGATVLFLARPGSGKSTLRKAIVEKFGATYVCNDEVRNLITSTPGAEAAGIEIKEVIAGVRDRILAETPNHFIVFDNTVSAYYMHHDSYSNVARRRGIRLFIIAIELSQEELKRRIITRGRHDAQQTLEDFDLRQEQQKAAYKDLRPDFTVTPETSTEELLTALQAWL